MPLTERCDVGAKHPLGNLPTVVHRCAPQGWFRPFELSVLRFTEISARASVLPDPSAATDLWKSAVLAHTTQAECNELSLSGVCRDDGAITIRVQATASLASTAETAIADSRLAHSSSANFLRMGPMARLTALRDARDPRDSALDFRHEGRKLDALRSIQASLPAFISPVRCFYSFCELAAIPDAILLWIAIFNDGRTFGNYANFVREAGFVLNEPILRYTAEVANAVKGLRLESKGEFRFPNFTRSGVAIMLLDSDPFNSHMSQLAFCAYLFSLQGSPGALQLRRASPP